ncbi:MAG TPA: hypothetical protein VJW73_13655 [Gemmatimonadaceae bacterium]|nr:hypothetical protein [Gemmatimonadaceae bacterium]
MLRRLIVPIFLILVVAGVGSMCTAISGAKAKRRLLQHVRESASTSTAGPAPTARTSKRVDSSEAPIVACPERLLDVSSWRRMSADGERIEIPVPPDFEVVSQSSPEAVPPFLVLRATNGDEYRLTHTTRGIHATDFRDYESTSTCRISISNILFADLETARDTWRGGEHRAVLASYFLGTMNFITVYGTTESREHQLQLVAAIHGASFRAR